MANEISILIKATNQASPALNQVKTALEKLGTSGQKAGTNIKKSWTDIAMGINQAMSIANRAITQIKKFYEAASEGADIVYTQEKFSNLAESIGTTADALERDLHNATQGLISDAEIMRSAVDFMALGLAKTHDEAVRLASVASTLGMNMNQLVLTLTNQTTMRFDALGLSVDGFKEKVEELKNAGLSAEDAFKEAFLQQAEAQIEKVGNAADSAKGDFMRFEAQVKNLEDASKLLAMTIGKELLPVLSEYVKALQDLVEWINGLDPKTLALIGNIFPSIFTAGAMTPGQYASIKYGNGLIDMRAEKLIAESIAAKQAENAEKDLINTISLFPLDDVSNFNAFIGLARDYTDTLGDIASYQDEIDNLRNIFKDRSWAIIDGKWVNTKGAQKEIDDLTGKIDDLKESMETARNELALGFMLETISADDIITEAEMQAYLNKAVELGLMSAEAAETAMADWLYAQLANEKFIAYVDIVLLGVTEAEADILELTKDRYLNMIIRMVGGDDIPQAAGGAITAASGLPHYYVGEVGPEPFFPAVSGRIVSNSDATAALRSGSGRSGDVNITINTPFNFADQVWVERELAPYIRDILQRERLIR